MESKSTHPDTQLFDYLNGGLDDRSEEEIKQHISECPECESVAEIVRALKSQAANLKSQIPESHPDVSRLATLFYGEHDPKTAAHVATCQRCIEELAEYSRVEQIAARYNPAQSEQAEIPERAWDMIRDWEETLFAREKPEIENLSEEMLLKLSDLLNEKKDQLREMERRVLEQPSDGGQAEMIPVVVVDNRGHLRGVELFETLSGPQGESILRHSEGSERFDSLPFHALLDYGEQPPVVISNKIRRDRVELPRPASSQTTLSRADYFIIED